MLTTIKVVNYFTTTLLPTVIFGFPNKTSKSAITEAFKFQRAIQSLWPPCVADADIIFLSCLWSPYVIGQTIIFSSCGYFFLLLSSSFFFSSPNLSPRRLVSTIRKNLLSSNISPTCPHNMLNFVPLAAEIDPVVWGTPANFNGFRVLAALLHGTLVVGVSQT